jgi:hypothetical protein
VNWVRALQISETIHLTVDPNFIPRSRSTAVHVGSQTLTVTQSASDRGEAERLTGLLFFQLFGRAASGQDIRDWAPKLVADRASTVHTLLLAGETAQRSRFVMSLYKGLLNRTPEQGGWLFQRAALAVIDSPEFKLHFGSPSDAEFVRIIYRKILGREATQAEVNWQVSMMMDKAVMATNTLLTPEAVTRFGRETTAPLIYHALLLRDAHPAEISSLEQALAGGKPLTQAVADVVSTAEFEALYR